MFLTLSAKMTRAAPPRDSHLLLQQGTAPRMGGEGGRGRNERLNEHPASPGATQLGLELPSDWFTLPAPPCPHSWVRAEGMQTVEMSKTA